MEYKDAELPSDGNKASFLLIFLSDSVFFPLVFLNFFLPE